MKQQSEAHVPLFKPFSLIRVLLKAALSTLMIACCCLLVVLQKRSYSGFHSWHLRNVFFSLHVIIGQGWFQIPVSSLVLKLFCSSKSVMLARLLLREHFQILGSYFLPHTNTVILLDWYCGIIKETGLFLLGSQTVPRSCESKHWLPCSADGRSFVLSVHGQVITKCFRNG